MFPHSKRHNHYYQSRKTLPPPFQHASQQKPPTEKGGSTFFVLHNVNALVYKANLIGKGDLNHPSCTGFLCDRAKAEVASKSCGCFFGKTNTNISVVVLEMNVKLVVESLIPELVPQRSMQTTMLFIKDPESSIGSLQHAAKVAHCRPLCQAIKKCVEYINDNGGFTIMGMITRDPRRKSRCLE